jgi:hypothetical protein
MLNWLKRRAQIAVIDAGQQDIDRFIEGLRGASSTEVGTVLACGYHWMWQLQREFDWNLMEPDRVVLSDPAAQMTLNQLIRSVQRKEPAMAVGLMIWLHTLRAANIPELRYSGRRMWKQLLRGAPHVYDGAYCFRLVAGVDLDLRFNGLGPDFLSPDGLDQAA